MSTEYPNSILEKLVALFISQGAEFIVVGGQAEFLFGSPRLTVDVDFCYARNPQNLEKVAHCLQQIHARLRGVPEGLPFRADAPTLKMGCNFTFVTDYGDFDLLGEVEPIGDYSAVLKHHETYGFGSYIINTISLDDLLRVKLHINRPKDQESLIQLRAIKRMRERGELGPQRP